MRKLMSVMIVALAILMAVTPVLAAGSGSQVQHQNQEVEKNQNHSQNQEQNQSETSQNQEKNLEQSKSQEQKQHQLGEGGNDEAAEASSLPGVQLFTLTGTIAALEDYASITVAQHNGNRFVKRLVEQGQLLVVVTGATEYRQYTGGTCIPADFSDLLVGDTVHIKGPVSVDAEGVITFTATRVTVDVPCLPTPI
jgi:type II secretory pathway pseudopilin PulG